MNRRHGINLNSRLLCPACSDVIRVTAIEGEAITLACGHTRPELLPSAPGCLSLESLRTKAGKEAFPGNSQGDLTTRPGFVEWKDARCR
jgi:hypothetical protein